MTPTQRIVALQRDILKIQRLLLRVNRSIDQLAQALPIPEPGASTESDYFNLDLLGFEQRIVARNLLHQAIEAGALLPDQARDWDDDNNVAEPENFDEQEDWEDEGHLDEGTKTEAEPAPSPEIVASAAIEPSIPPEPVAAASDVSATVGGNNRVRVHIRSTTTARRLPQATLHITEEAHQGARNLAYTWSIQRQIARQTQQAAVSRERIARRQRQENERTQRQTALQRQADGTRGTGRKRK
eukprot:scaffold83770_cov33-Attheya_sp.AAC.2